MTPDTIALPIRQSAQLENDESVQVEEQHTSIGKSTVIFWNTKITNPKVDAGFLYQSDVSTLDSVYDAYINLSVALLGEFTERYEHEKLVKFLKVSESYNRSFKSDSSARLFLGTLVLFMQSNYDNDDFSERAKLLIPILERFSDSNRDLSQLKIFIREARRVGLVPLK